jgi:hypothetical protein
MGNFFEKKAKKPLFLGAGNRFRKHCRKTKQKLKATLSLTDGTHLQFWLPVLF